MIPLLTAVAEGGQLGDHDGLSPTVPWWSLTKTALAAGALALVAGDRLALDAPLGSRPFTARQLLQHTAGLPDYGDLAAYHEAVVRGQEPWSPDELTRRVGSDRLLFQPGQGWAYSNLGYLFVRDMIEDRAGEDIGAALHRLVFAPLGVPGVKIARVPEHLAGTAWGNATGYHPGWVYHGLATGTPADAALFLHRLLTGGLLPAVLLDGMGDRCRAKCRGTGRARVPSVLWALVPTSGAGDKWGSHL
jgi:CubicO group peptidase (beta-lactamase class C family)